MPTFEVRLSQTLEAGRARHGDAWYEVAPEELIEQLAAEAADLAGWAWVLHTRAGRYPEAERGFVRDGLEHLAVLSIRLMRAIAVLAVEGPYTETAGEHRAPAGWLEALRHPEDWSFPRRVTGRVPVEAWALLVADRLEAGSVEYGDLSFERDGGELCIELGDEATGLAGWAYVLRGRAETFEPTARAKVDQQLGGLVRASAAAYDRVRAIQHICVGVDTKDETPDYQYSVQQWISAIVARERRHGSTAAGRV